MPYQTGIPSTCNSSKTTTTTIAHHHCNKELTSNKEENADNHLLLNRIVHQFVSHHEYYNDNKHHIQHQHSTCFASLAKNNHLFGRQEEIQRLCQAYHRISSSTSSELVLVRGASGMGKSALVREFVSHHVTTTIMACNSPDIDADDGGHVSKCNDLWMIAPKAFFVSGKFDQLQMHLPYAALWQAANQLVNQIIRLQQQTRQQHENSNDDHDELDKDDNILERIRTELGPEQGLLSNFIQVSLLLGNHQSSSTKNNNLDWKSIRPSTAIKTRINAEAYSRIKILIRAFLRACASPRHPVVLFLDDLQWADEDTIDVLKGIMTDKSLHHILLICGFRDDEMNHETLRNLLSATRTTTSASTVPHNNNIFTTDISVSHLTPDALHTMISTLLNTTIANCDIKSLSRYIFHQTGGNPLFVLHFLDRLASMGVLKRGTKEEWTWDTNFLQQQKQYSCFTIVSTTHHYRGLLGKMVQEKAMKLPEKTRSLLQLASFLGHSFTIDILTTIIVQHAMATGKIKQENRQEIQSRLLQSLEVAIDNGLLVREADDADSFIFSHDQIQLSLYLDLMPDETERRLVHQMIGKLVWETIQQHKSTFPAALVDDGGGRILFLTADNLNCGLEQQNWRIDEEIIDPRHVIQLNIMAARLAASRAATRVAVEYLRKAIQCATATNNNNENDDNEDGNTTTTTIWQRDYNLGLQLYLEAAEMERMVGNLGQSSFLVQEIHKEARTLEDRFPAFITEIKVVALEGNLRGAIQKALVVLGFLGFKFPPKTTKLTIMREYMRTTHAIGNRRPSDMIQLSILTDQHKIFVLELLSLVRLHAFISGDSEINTMILAGLKMAYLTVRNGLSPVHAPLAFIEYGLVCCFLGKFHLGLEFEKVAMALQQKFGTDDSSFDGRTLILSMGFIRPWIHGMDAAGHEAFKLGYHKAMIGGDIDFAHWGITGWMLSGFFFGVIPMNELAKKSKAFCLEMKELGTQSQLLTNLPLWQLVLNFQDVQNTKNPSLLEGEAIPKLDEFNQKVKDFGAAIVMYSFKLSELVAAVHFGNWKHIEANIFSALAKVLPAADGYWYSPCGYAWFGWVCYELYHRTTKQKQRYWYRIKARKCSKLIAQSAQRGSALSVPLLTFMEAGKFVFFNKSKFKHHGEAKCRDVSFLSKVDQKLNSAMDALEERGLVILQTVVCETLAELHLKYGSQKVGHAYLERSLQIYRDLGAAKKVETLMQKLSSSSQPLSGPGPTIKGAAPFEFHQQMPMTKSYRLLIRESENG